MAVLVTETGPDVQPAGQLLEGLRSNEPCVRRARLSDRDELVRFVAGLSPSSTQHRFLTGLGGRLPLALVERMLTGGPGGGAFVVTIDGELVAHALWARAGKPDAPVAEIAMVVADAHPRRGIGSRLLEALRAELLQAGVERVQVVTGSGNRTVLGMIGRRRPGAKPVDRDGAALTFDLPVFAAPGSRWSS
jgi:GNAT superfamily N-acetyltransferase